MVNKDNFPEYDQMLTDMNYKKLWEESDKIRLDNIRILEKSVNHLKQMSAGESFRRYGFGLTDSRDEWPELKEQIKIIDNDGESPNPPWLYEDLGNNVYMSGGNLTMNDKILIGKLPWVNSDTGTVDNEWYNNQP